MFTCKCLNITINAKTFDLPSVDLENLKLSQEEKDDPFFKEDLGKADIQSIAKEQACLVHVRSVAFWIIHRCLNCRMETHALHREKGATCVLINLKMLTDSTTIMDLKRSATYSPVFRIVVNLNFEDISTENSFGEMNAVGSLQPSFAALQQQLTEALQRESQQVEERIRLYSEEQFSQLEEFRKKAHEDHQTLSRLLFESRTLSVVGSPSASNSHIPSSETKSAIMPTLPPPPFSSKHIPSNSEVGRMSMASLSQNLPTPPSSGLNSNLSHNEKISTSFSEPRPVPSVHVLAEKSADSEGLFLLDEVDENPPETFQSEDETDSDDSGSHDEGIHIPRARGGTTNLAQSLPVSVPVFPGERSHGDDFDEDNMLPQDPLDIAASIKALARSVHGDTVFGDLPRPRFSTQI